MRAIRICGCDTSVQETLPVPERQASDTPIEASAEELAAIRNQLHTIEGMLSTVYGPAYSRTPKSLQARAEAADLIERHFDGILEQWQMTVEALLLGNKPRRSTGRSADMNNSMVRFIAHLRDPNDLRTYVHLRHHCHEGMLSRAAPYQFNVVHIALKKIVLDHVRAAMPPGPHMEIVRDAVVAAIDER